MTAYFDETHERLRAVDLTDWRAVERLGEIEQKLVFDCTIAAMWEGFPPEVAKGIHTTIMLGAVQMQPRPLPEADIADFETIEEHVQRLHSLCWDLHTHFHNAALTEGYPYGDSPLNPTAALFGKGEEVRDHMAAERAGTTLEAWMRERYGDDF